MIIKIIIEITIQMIIQIIIHMNIQIIIHINTWIIKIQVINQMIIQIMY